MEGDTAGLSLRDVSQPADASDGDPEPATASSPDAGGLHESHLAALIADTALEEVNPCRAMGVAAFLDNEHLSAVGRRMRVASQDTTLLGPHSPESDGLFPQLAQYAKRMRELLVDFTLRVPSF